MDIFPIKSYYNKDEEVTLKVVFEGEIKPQKANLKVRHLDELILETKTQIGEDGEIRIPLNFEPGRAYYLEAAFENGKKEGCAFEVLEKPEILRYGFLSDFDSSDADDSDIETMTAHHINMVQYYDWSYRHDSLVAADDEYVDMMGKTISKPVVLRKIRECKKRRLLSIGYGAVYAAGKEFAETHKEWRLYARPDSPIRFIDVFSIMNLDSDWEKHIIEQYKNAMEKMGFDGIHMDTYGFPKTAYDQKGETIYLEEGFEKLIKDVREQLTDGTFVFNNVGNWPVNIAGKCPVDAVYIEVWPPYESFTELRELILNAKRYGKPVIIAAYPKSFRTDTMERAMRSQIITMCGINFLGATQLFFGEKNAVLTQGYYSDYTVIKDEDERALRKYDDFFTRYEEIIFDKELVDVSMTHAYGDNHEYSFSGNTSPNGRAGTLWTIIRESRKRKAIFFINLCGNDNLWNEGKEEPLLQEKVEVTVQSFGKAQKILYASPDEKEGNVIEPHHEYLRFPEGDAVKILIPKIKYAGMLLIEY